MAAHINGISIPAAIVGRGRYVAKAPEILARNGQGQLVESEYRSVVWTFPRLNATDFTWWYQTVVSSGTSLLITSADLWDTLGNLVTYSHGVLIRPTYEYVTNYYYMNVVVTIENLV